MSLDLNNALKINIDNYTGPLDVLLDLAKAQKVDLENISITQLADQFIEFINDSKNVDLSLASEYLLMATWSTKTTQPPLMTASLFCPLLQAVNELHLHRTQ